MPCLSVAHITCCDYCVCFIPFTPFPSVCSMRTYFTIFASIGPELSILCDSFHLGSNHLNSPCVAAQHLCSPCLSMLGLACCGFASASSLLLVAPRFSCPCNACLCLNVCCLAWHHVDIPLHNACRLDATPFNARHACMYHVQNMRTIGVKDILIKTYSIENV